VNDSLTVTRAGSRSVDPGPAEWFTGTVRIEPLFAATDSWHGASPPTAMTHIAIQEQLDGKAVAWLEYVTDEQYQGR
jgi:hypothetical protein